eukprot:TRINITY_DN46140_c0_g1_i1.p1 TRINITY_DN46140_c0_g1~~TRINITY_DN46140_c0_g1_i1.p1  ORF type:complete len:461 (-),score=148.58 TRINITY_DN46140_c0_g1_i1:206-1588(-)
MAEGGDAAEAERKAAAAAAAGQQPASPVDRETASRTFFTSIDAQPETKGKKDATSKRNQFRTLSESGAGPQIQEYHGDITNLALTLDQRMNALLNEHEKDFFLAYKTHMYTVQREIKNLRMKAAHEEAKTREDTTIKDLESELDWFMTEALRLDELCKGYKKEVDKWKQKAEALDEDRRFLEDQIKGAKRQNKILRAAAERARSSAYSALMVTKARTEAQQEQERLALTNGATGAQFGVGADVTRRPASAEMGTAPGATRLPARGDMRARTPDALQGSAGAAILPAAGAAVLGLGGSRPGAGAYPAAVTSMAVSPTAAGRSVLGNEAEERYVEAIQHLKESIVREQHNVRMLQAARASSYSQKSELEEFFLKCIDDARKELMRRRHLTMHKEKDEREQVLEAMLHNEDALACLYERIFPHRTGIARSLGGGNDFSENRGALLTQTPMEDRPGNMIRAGGR